MSEIKLAIVIPYYKLTYFEETLISLQNQSNQNFNVYIGDDKSPQSPESLLKDYQSNFNIFYKKFDENLGSKGELVHQWNRCIDLSKDEEWIIILADDDYLSYNFVEEFYKSINVANCNNINLLRFKMRRVTFDNSFLIDLEQPKLYDSKNYVWEDEIQERFISISENVFRRSVFEEVGFRNYPLAWRVPYMMYLDFTKSGKVLGVNSAFVAIRRSNSQLTRRNDMDSYKKIAMKECYFDILNEYSSLFSNKQNLRFLKIYHYYNKDNNRLKKSFNQLFLKYGGIKALAKYNFKELFNK